MYIYVDVNSNIREMKNSMAKITQNRRIALFSLWSFNQSKAGKEKKDVEIFALQKEKYSL